MGVTKICKAIDCTYDDLCRKRDTYLSKLREGDVAFVYCAVHGARYLNHDVVLAADSDWKTLDKTSMSTLDLLQRSGTCCGVCTHPGYMCAFTQSICIHDSIAQKGPRTIVIVLDCCRVFEESHAHTTIKTLSAKSLQTGHNSLMVYTCAPNDTAADNGTHTISWLHRKYGFIHSKYPQYGFIRSKYPQSNVFSYLS